MVDRRPSRPQAQVLRSQICGSTSIGAASGPWLVTVIRMQRSSASALA